jgi:hypothetical protein
MATILLSAAGAAIGSAIGGTAFGLSAAVIGRAVGATVGRVIDARILGAGSPAVERGKVDRFRLTGASEGAPIATAHGRVRIAGQVIWASRFEEIVTESGGGKGAPSQPTVRNYSYSVSLAIALCEGEISRVGRVWADGNEISRRDLTLRVYSGSEDQLPDPKIEAVEGVGQAPAYRGVAYVVIEDLDLGRFGNRVPAFSFEVMRTGEGDLAEHVRAVAVIPGTGEYALATTAVHFEEGPGRARSANVHTPWGGTDFEVSLEALAEELPRCEAASLVVSWFGDDLRCGSCAIRPKVEQAALDGIGMPWSVSGIDRASAGVVPFEGTRPVYGGTPSDASVIEAIRAMAAVGQAVMFYPFILMEQMDGNGRPDPWTGAADQPVLPWRGRITTSLAPGREGSPDGTAAAEAEVAAFFGTARATDFDVTGGGVRFTGTDTGSYRRFILHYAHLCAVSGGVDAFCIGSEMRSLTQIRGGGNSFPAVDALRDLAAEVRGILGASVRVGYAADWSEYFGYHPQDGSGDVFFHLDPLWSDPQIDFIGIDNYMPLSDWREGPDHADAGWGAIYNPDYLKANIAGGEGYDWFYRTAEAEALQLRSPITDGAYGEPWVFRYKDLRNWWQERHYDRPGGVRASLPTDWEPGMKPIWFTEIGCAAIDKGTNQPNKFLDPKSSESALPKYSNGGRDDLIQMQYLRAIAEFWSDPSNNPVSEVYGEAMVEAGRMFVWAWDARPYPFFPGNTEVWSDGGNYARGHWLTGRSTSRSLAGVVREICIKGGVESVETDQLYGVVRGFSPTPGEGARSRLQGLLLAYSADAVEKDGALVFRNRTAGDPILLTQDELASGDGGALVAFTRAPEAEVSGRVRLAFVEADGDYEIRSVDSIFPDEASQGVAESELAIALTAGEAKATVDRWLSEARVGRDLARFAVPPSCDLAAGDVVRLEAGAFRGTYRIDRIEDAGAKQIEAVRVEASIYDAAPVEEETPVARPVAVPLPVWASIRDLPVVPGREDNAAPWIAATADAWPGDVAVYSSRDGASWGFETLLSRRAVMGQSLNDLREAYPSVWDRGEALDVRLVHGSLSSIDEGTLFAGGNLAVIFDPEGTESEVFQFRDAVLSGPQTWSLSMRLRGQQGTDAAIRPVWPAGSGVILIDEALSQLGAASGQLETPRHYRIGPAARPVDHASYVEVSHQANGLALMPYRPAHLRATRTGDGSLEVRWTRRTRVDGDGWTLSEVPLGEVFEAYRVRIRAAGLLRREVTVSVPYWTYGVAEQAEDALAGGFTVEVAQISDRVGPGHFARIEING